jgi:hypothetical protein
LFHHGHHKRIELHLTAGLGAAQVVAGTVVSNGILMLAE